MADNSGISSTGLELLLEFDNSYNDTSSNARHQTPKIGAAVYASDGAVGQAAKFSYGRRNHIDTGVNALGTADLFCSSSSSNFTVATGLRFKDDSIFGAGTICARQEGTGFSGISSSNFFLHVESDGRLLVRLRGQDNYYNVTLRDGSFHSIVVTWNGTVAKLWVDGTAQTNPSVGNVSENSVNIFIGGSSLPGIAIPSSNLVGQLDDFRVYSRALSDAEVNLFDLYIRPSSAGGGDVELENLELLLRFEDDLLDSSGNARHQTSNLTTMGDGSLTYAAGTVGVRSSVWAGSDGNIYIDTGVTDLGDASLFANTGEAWSVSVWVRDTGSNGGGITISKGDAFVNNHIFVIVADFDAATTPEVRIGLRNPASTNTYSISGLDNGNWHHIAVTWNGSAAAVYVDGTAKSAPTVGSTADNGNIIIGAIRDTNGATPAYNVAYDGGMDDLRVYSRALSAADVTNIYNNSGLDTFSVTLTVQSITIGDTVTVAVTFGTAVTTFVSGDISVTNGTAGTPSGSGTSWTFVVTPTDDNPVTVSIPAGNVTADTGQDNAVSNTLQFSAGGTVSASDTGLLQFDRTATPTFTANAIIGPIKLSQNATWRSAVTEMLCIFSSATDATGSVNMAFGLDGEDAINRIINNTFQYSTTIAAIVANHGKRYPRGAGHALAFEIDVTGAGELNFEQAELVLEPYGRNRGARYS